MRTAFTTVIIGAVALSVASAATESHQRVLHPTDDVDDEKWEITKVGKIFGKIRL